jgi:hypothetical protein
MSNVDKLVEAGLVDPSQLSDEHREIIENELTIEEIDALVSVQHKLGDDGSMHASGIFF